jgi:GntR family transcriptional regulator
LLTSCARRSPDGQLESGEKLPSENELAERFETTRPTVRRAIALLKAEGLVTTEQGTVRTGGDEPRNLT